MSETAHSIKLSVVIVNYNGQGYLKDCLNSLKSNLSGLTYEIILVDNNSEDHSCLFIRKEFPEVILIESSQNLGFGKANNLGVKHSTGDTILLINNDTIVQNHLLPAIETLYTRPKTGVVTINMVDRHKKYISGVGRFPTPLRLLKISFLNYNSKAFKTGSFDSILYNVDWVCGAFMLVKKSDYDQLNGFDTDYFMYIEDVDFCKRMSYIGKKCVFQSDLSYVHFVGFNKSREYLLLNGYKMYAEKHFNWLGKIIGKTMITINRNIKKLKY